MKLMIKFNLVFIAVFLAGLLFAGKISYTLLQNNARDEILQNARIMIEAAEAQRTYTNTQIKPLLETQMKYNFLPQTVPAYAATESFNALRVKIPGVQLQGSNAQPHQSAGPHNRLGGGYRRPVPSGQGDRGDRRRASHTQRAFAVHGPPDSDQERSMSDLSQHRGGGAEDHAGQLRQRQRFRLEVE